MKSERTFVTFRVAGDDLAPHQLTALLRMQPTLAYAKGEHYRLGPRSSNLRGRTGVWLLSTDGMVQSNRLTDHIDWVISNLASHQEELRLFIARNLLHAVLSCFWHGPNGAKPPTIPQQTFEVVAAIPASLEQDFDTDADDVPPAVTTRLEVP